ncbi:MAG: AraC family transcriptional regulator ligand-binding domain-containing protein [Halioglobus sp.]
MNQTATSGHSMLATYVLPVAQALRQQGVDPLPIMADAGIDLARAANPDWRIASADFHTLMGRCLEITGDEAFGLVAAEQLQPQALHGLGLGWLASDTIFAGLVRLERFVKIVSTGVKLDLQEEGDLVHLSLDEDVDVENFVHAARDYGVGMVTRMCRLTLGDFLAPVLIQIDRPVPQAPERWEYLLASRVVFGTGLTRISWSGPDIREPLVTGDPALARANDEQAQAYLDSLLAPTMTRAVVDKIVEHLPDGPPSQQQIAEALHVSSRTLQRKLREEGATFKELVQEARLHLAHKYLRERNCSVLETAYLLGFSEASTFSRAFKRWTGMAPAEYRDRATPR